MFKELESDIEGFKRPNHGHLVGWARQGEFFSFDFPARGGKCSNGRIVPNTAFTFRVFVVTSRSLSNLCILSSFHFALNLKHPGGE